MGELWTYVVALFHTALGALPAFNPNSAVWPSVTGSLTGAITGGMITYLVQRTIAGWARRQRAIEREDNNLVIAISLALKALKIYSNILGIKEVIGEHQRQATQRYPNAQFDWTHLPPFVSKPPHVEYTLEERRFLVTEMLGGAIEAIELPDIHNDLIQIVSVYSEQRIALAIKMPTQNQGKGFRGLSDLTPEQLSKLIPHFMMLDSLIQPMIDRSRDDLKQARAVFDNIMRVGKEKFGKRFPNFEIFHRSDNTVLPPS